MKTRHVLIIVSSIILLITLYYVGYSCYMMGITYGEQNAELIRKERLLRSYINYEVPESTIPKYVKTKVISNKTIPLTIKSFGRVIASSNINISTEVQGKLTGIIELKKGSEFKKGQILIKIDDRDAQLALNARKMQLFKCHHQKLTRPFN